MPEPKQFDRDPAESQFPSGTYYCRLDRIQEIPEKEAGKGPRLVFEFVVADGQYTGKKTASFVGKKLWKNPKLGTEAPLCKLAKQLGCPDPMKGFDPDLYLGKYYQVTVELTGEGDQARAWVRFVCPAVAGSSPAANPPASSGPPPRPGRGVTNAGKPAPAFYWVETNPDAELVQAADLRKFFDDPANAGLDPRVTLVCPDGGSEYKAAVDYDSSLLF
jgi:hypothetical protein